MTQRQMEGGQVTFQFWPVGGRLMDSVKRSDLFTFLSLVQIGPEVGTWVGTLRRRICKT